MLSESWGLPEGQPQLEGVPIRDHANKTEVATAGYYWAEDGQLWQRSRAGLLVRNTKGRVIRIEEIKGKDGKDNRAPVVCEEGSACIPDGIRPALVFDWPDAMRAEVKAKLDEMHSHTEFAHRPLIASSASSGAGHIFQNGVTMQIFEI